MRSYMGLVQRGCMHDDINSAHAAADEIGVGNRADVRRERRVKQVEPCDFVPTPLECADESLAEMAGTSCDKNSHGTDLTPDPAGTNNWTDPHNMRNSGFLPV